MARRRASRPRVGDPQAGWSAPPRAPEPARGADRLGTCLRAPPLVRRARAPREADRGRAAASPRARAAVHGRAGPVAGRAHPVGAAAGPAAAARPGAPVPGPGRVGPARARVRRRAGPVGAAIEPAGRRTARGGRPAGPEPPRGTREPDRTVPGRPPEVARVAARRPDAVPARRRRATAAGGPTARTSDRTGGRWSGRDGAAWPGAGRAPSATAWITARTRTRPRVGADPAPGPTSSSPRSSCGSTTAAAGPSDPVRRPTVPSASPMSSRRTSRRSWPRRRAPTGTSCARASPNG